MTPQNKNQPATVKKDHPNKRTNKILEDHGEWLLIDIGTPKFPCAKMAVDTDVFESHEGGRIYAFLPTTSKYIYGRYSISYKSFLFHRDVVNAGVSEVDHIVHGSMTFVDNRRSNLRVATHQQNMTNFGARTDSESGITGVCWVKKRNKWCAQIQIKGNKKHLGLFDNIDFAIGARKQAEREYFGDFAFKGAK